MNMTNLCTRLVVLFATLFTCRLAAVEIDISKHPTIGNLGATVQVVALLEPKCPDSKRYNNASFPKLKAAFIDTNKISYTVITTSFLSNSMPAAIALLCVYTQDEKKTDADLFFKYLNYLYQVQPPERQNWATTDTLLSYAAKASQDIDLKRLKSCIESKRREELIVQNTALGNKLMGELHTPTIFVNGVKIENKDDTIDYEKLQTAIDEAISKKNS